MYRDSTWQNAKPGHKLKVERETNKSSKSISLYACAIKTKHQFFGTWFSMRHIPRETSRPCCFIVVSNITGYYICTTYKVFPIPAGGLEVLLPRTFSVKSERIIILMKIFVNDLYDYDYTGEQAENNEEESGDDEEVDIKLKGERNATNENNENVIEIDYPFFISNST